jgi:hypothetical protein
MNISEIKLLRMLVEIISSKYKLADWLENAELLEFMDTIDRIEDISDDFIVNYIDVGSTDVIDPQKLLKASIEAQLYTVNPYDDIIRGLNEKHNFKS